MRLRTQVISTRRRTLMVRPHTPTPSENQLIYFCLQSKGLCVCTALNLYDTFVGGHSVKRIESFRCDEKNEIMKNALRGGIFRSLRRSENSYFYSIFVKLLSHFPLLSLISPKIVLIKCSEFISKQTNQSSRICKK